MSDKEFRQWLKQDALKYARSIDRLKQSHPKKEDNKDSEKQNEIKAGEETDCDR